MMVINIKKQIAYDVKRLNVQWGVLHTQHQRKKEADLVNR